MNDLALRLQAAGWKIFYLHNPKYGNPEVSCYYTVLKLPLTDLVKFFTTVKLYVGYDSGWAHVAAGFNIPHVLLLGATPAVTVRHDSCLYTLQACDPCCTGRCQQLCLQATPNRNDDIMKAIKEKFS